jgi:maltose O-acetyltransferase
MASLQYLWKNRARFKFGTRLYFRAWAKRIYSLPAMFKRNRHKNKLIREGATICSTAEIGEIRALGKKQNLSVGSYSFLGKVEIALHTAVSIGNCVCINDGVQILTASHDVLDTHWSHIMKPIIIEDYAWIATNAIILPGVHIGRGAVVGAGAVVSKNVQPREIVVGNPATAISKRRSEKLDYNPCEFIASNRAWLIG